MSFQFHEKSFDLLEKGLVLSVPCQDKGEPFDACSIQTMFDDNSTSFGTGVVTVQKSNHPKLGGIAVGAGTTITTATITSLTGTDWFKQGYLLFSVTTASAASVQIKLIVRMARLGFSV